MASFFQIVDGTHRIQFKSVGAAVQPPAENWTLVLNFDPSWIGNSNKCVAVSGYLMSSGPYPIAPWIPPGTS